MKICILIPIYNESRAIGNLVRALKETRLDIFVVDDGSEDGAGKIASDCGAVVLRHEQRGGKGFSLRRGFDHVLKEYQGVILVDGDGQHDPKDVPTFVKMAKTYESRACVIVGNRMCHPKGMPWVRYLTNRFMSVLISMACRQWIDDTQCGFRYISCDVLKNISLGCNGFEIETEILMKACKKGFKVYSIGIQTIYRDEESKIDPVKDTVRFFIYFFRELFAIKK